MALSPRDLATALLRAAQGKDEAETAKVMARFVARLRRSGLVSLLPRVLAALSLVQRDGVTAVTVESARPPGEAELAAALRLLGLDEKSAKLEFRENPALLGGLRLRTFDRVLDLTAARRLADLGQAIGATRTR